MRTSKLGRKLAVVAAVAVAVFGLVPSASAGTVIGVDGFPVLFAVTADSAHVCNVISASSDTAYQAVVCADLTTSQSGNTYYVKASAEAYCQTPSGTAKACESVDVYTYLAMAGGDSRGPNGKYCGTDPDLGPACTTARNIASTSTWSYSIPDNGCEDYPLTDYDVWGLVLGYDNGVDSYSFTSIETPDGKDWVLGDSGQSPNNGANESTGHNYICP